MEQVPKEVQCSRAQGNIRDWRSFAKAIGIVRGIEADGALLEKNPTKGEQKRKNSLFPMLVYINIAPNRNI